MELAAELFEQIVTALGGGPGERASGKDADKRHAGRLVLTAEVLVNHYDVVSSEPWKVKLKSLSRSGAAVIDWHAMHPGEKLVLFLPKPDGTTVPVVCMIMNTRLSGSEFRLGMQFLSRAEQTGAPMVRGCDGLVNRPNAQGTLYVLDEIAEKGVVPTPTGGGREERVELNVQAMKATYAEGRAGDMGFVTVKDISRNGGVCILQQDEMNKGEQFVLQIPRQKGKPLTVLCTAVDCRKLAENNYRIGARFETSIAPPAAGEANTRGVFGRFRRWLAA